MMIKQFLPWRSWIGTSVAVAAVIGGSASMASSQAVEEPVGAPLTAYAVETFPFLDFYDWVSFADHVAVASISEEIIGDPDQYGSIAARVTLKVERLVWSSPEVRADSLLRPEDEISLNTHGYWQTERGVHPVLSADSDQMQRGGRYVIALVNLGGQWAALTDSSVVNVTSNGSVDFSSHRNAASLVGQISVTHLETLLSGLPTVFDGHPMEGEIMRLPPVERLAHLTAEVYERRDEELFAQKSRQ